MIKERVLDRQLIGFRGILQLASSQFFHDLSESIIAKRSASAMAISVSIRGQTVK